MGQGNVGSGRVGSSYGLPGQVVSRCAGSGRPCRVGAMACLHMLCQMWAGSGKVRSGQVRSGRGRSGQAGPVSAGWGWEGRSVECGVHGRQLRSDPGGAHAPGAPGARACVAMPRGSQPCGAAGGPAVRWVPSRGGGCPSASGGAWSVCAGMPVVLRGGWGYRRLPQRCSESVVGSLGRALKRWGAD
jgi:hypothetical protein